jgi:hypothetical protein
MPAPNQYQRPMGQAPQFMPQGMNTQSAQPNFAQLLSQRNYGPQQQQSPDFWGGLKNYLVGTEGRYDQVSNLHPHQQYAQDQTLASGLNALQNPYAGFDPIAQETMRQFHSEYIPGLLEQFTAGYNNSDRGTSALSGALGAAGSGLQSMLAAQRAQYGLQNRQQSLSEINRGLQPQFENVYRPGQEGLLSQLPQLVAEGALNYATGGLSGASGIANLIGKGVTAARKLGGSKKESSTEKKPVQSAAQFEAESQRVADINRQYPSTAQGYGPTQLHPAPRSWFSY